ncbi:hypothetical protein [Kitasatospora sp. NPDC085879]|uniref:hypothetical protein n=1 Tax=Kitasatospora sp. NPDC085879 TaxID=3154769 RepID=UPI003416E1BF
MPGALRADVAEVLGILLADDDPAHVALRLQIPHLSVHASCTCGCGTTYFGLDRGAVEPPPSEPGTRVAAQALIHTTDGTCPGEVLAFTTSGYLSWLEVSSWDDDTDVTLGLARRSLHR